VDGGIDSKCLVTCGWDGQLLISDDNAPVREAKLIFKTKPEGEEGKKENIKPFNCIDVLQTSYEEKNKITGKNSTIYCTILAVGNSEGKVSLIDMSNHRYIQAFNQYYSIQKIKFFANHPLMAVSDESGRICI
jgi:hypothetical protein